MPQENPASQLAFKANPSKLHHAVASDSSEKNSSTASESTEKDSNDVFKTSLDESQTIEESESGLATNSGSTTGTLDGAFRNALHVVKENNLTGSNRASFYEAASTGKSDAEEELDALNKKDSKP